MSKSRYHKRLYKDARKLNEQMKSGTMIPGYDYNPDFPKSESDFLRARMQRLEDQSK